MESALELLAPDEEYKPTVMEKIWCPVTFGLFGFGAACFMNWGTKRPVFCRIHRHIAFTAIGAVSGQYVENRNSKYNADRDAIYRHYIELHPEDFQRSERKTFGQVLYKWRPVR